MRIARSVIFTLSALAVMQAPAMAQTPEQLGWEAGVVAPSPLRGVWENKKLATKSLAQKAKVDAQAEIARVKKLRAAQKALCQEKIFVNACVNKAEKVLRDRERFANQLLRTADHELRMMSWNEKRAQPKPEDLMPQKNAPAASVTDQELKAQGKRVTERARQEVANEKAFDEKQQAQAERKARLQAEAAERKARREARRAQHEADKKAREEAQRHQETKKDKSSVFF
ncbi:MAG: hypothetical protein J6V64_04425 [Burkholderiaceae bacterium]|nr:hypothetical protein [Burkholderiaceae bacterium]